MRHYSLVGLNVAPPVGVTYFMPNRILRDCTDSDKVNSLTGLAERFFYRLFMKADDYGCFYADPRLLKANLFPLQLDTIKESDVSKWLTECTKLKLISVYTYGKRQYLQITDFGQQLRQKKHKFPMLSDCLQPDSELIADGKPPSLETKQETNTETKQETKGSVNHLFSLSEFYEVGKFIDEVSKDEKYLCFNISFYHESIKNWSAEGNMKKNWIATAKNWMLRDYKDGKAKLINQKNGKQSKSDESEQAIRDFINTCG